MKSSYQIEQDIGLRSNHDQLVIAQSLLVIRQ